MVPRFLASLIAILMIDTPSDSMEEDTIEVAELFAGVGGFRLGLEGGDFKFVFSNQWEPPGTKAASNLSMAPSSYPLLD